MKETKRSLYEKLRAQLENERSSFMSHWRELGEYILPRRPRFTITDGNRGDRRNQKIIDSTATMAIRTLSSGMTSGITSPARPWFRLTTPDPDLSEASAVKQWLYTVQSRMNTVFGKSNLYEVLPTLYSDMATFGTGAMLAEEDFDQVIRFYSIPVGSYCIANDSRGKAAVFLRQFRMTVRQLVDKFGNGEPVTNGRFSSLTVAAYQNGQMEAWVDVCHIIQPNMDYDSKRLGGKYKKYSSCYYERSVGDRTVPASEDVFLRESGYDNFPVFVTRWETTGEDIYGTNSPGMIMLGDVKALQLMHKRKAQAIEKMVNPPMVAPPEMRTEKLTILPGEVNYHATRDGMQGIRPAHEVNFRIEALIQDIADHQRRIREAAFADLFLMISQDERNQRATATEITERREEKLLALGPVLEQLNQDLLDPLIDLTYFLMDAQGLIPPAPEELQGSPLRVEYISIMAQAQKLVSVGGIERFQQFLMAQMQMDPNVGDSVDMGVMVGTYGEITSIPPGIVRPMEEVQAIRAQKAQAAQAQQMAEQVPAMAGAAQQLGNTPMDTDNALTRLLGTAQAGTIAPQQ
jgi:hypothetical protein